MRCIATSGPTRTNPTIRTSSTSYEIAFEPDAALLLCSDGLTDLVHSSSLHDIVKRFAGRPDQVVKELIDAANAAGGKDNVSVVYVEGERFAPADDWEARAVGEITRRGETHRPVVEDRRQEGTPRGRRTNASRAAWLVAIALAAASISAAAVRLWPLGPVFHRPSNAAAAVAAATIAVGPTESIARGVAAGGSGFGRARRAGRVPRDAEAEGRRSDRQPCPAGATIRLSGTASEGDAAVVAAGVVGAELAGFRIVGDAATPLGTGVLIRASQTSLVDIEVTGAANAAIVVDGMSVATILASDVHDNPGAALTIRAATARLAHNVFMRNGTSERVRRSFIIDEGANPLVTGNVFQDVSRDTFGDLSDGARAVLSRDNWFADAPDVRSTSSTTPPVRPGR